ncbi:dephospho-CoA kinase [Raineya orbicola]|jgi:dephospho-CoA kinase|uniref:Dephospho-CoA kinase n=1 Tax=Raineya orbicola TaxID=2016530 RepID=A0A2N3IEC3_9BACT|nr:dephospho-CoA kinase [Raineya orbicola]PKQ68583.1 Dephospho-CoA kinase [Raineya orbicola]
MIKPLQIGITGGIGSGKSTVARIFQVLGIPVYDADSRAKAVMIQNDSLKKAIITNFGENAYLADGSLNRRFLAEQVFSDGEKTKLINSLVHPAVAQDYEQWLAHQQSTPYVIREAALMIESGAYRSLDKLIVVTAPEELRLQRIRTRDPQRSEAEIRGIIAKQMPEDEKLKFADFIIYNDEKHSLIEQVWALHKNFLQIF